MFEPEYTCSISLVNNKVKMMGNLPLASKIEEMVKDFINQNKSLYQAQEEIKALLVKDFGDEWYDKSGEAINYIIENEYANIERNKLPALDIKQYEFDIRHGVLY